MATSQRIVAKDTLIELLRTVVPTNVEVDRWKMEPAPEAIYLGDIKGSSSLKVMMGGRKSRDDQWSQELIIGAALPGQDAATAETRVLEIYGYVEDVLAEDPTLDGVVDHAWLERVDGPDALARSEGWVAEMHCTIACQLRLT